MFLRDSWHHVAMELDMLSARFRRAYLAKDQLEMQAASVEGMAALQQLVSVRREQDFGRLPRPNARVGGLCRQCVDVVAFMKSYRPPYTAAGLDALDVREALNKIMHADERVAGFRATADLHELLVSGIHKKDSWVAVISIPDFCRVVRSLPDQPINPNP